MSQPESQPQDLPRSPQEQLLLSLREADWQQWRHNPITAAYLHYLSEVVKVYREAAADLVIRGSDLRALDRLAGQIVAFDELHTLTLGGIQRFYRQEGTEEANDRTAPADKEPAR